MPSADLQIAAHESYEKAYTPWPGLTLGTQMTAYMNDIIGIFSDGNQNERTVLNWVVPMKAAASLVAGSIQQLRVSVNVLYRVNLAGFDAHANSRITAAQRTAMLAAWNVRFP